LITQSRGEIFVTFGTWIGFFALVLAIYVLWQIKQVVLLLFTAVLLATALNMLVNQLQILSEKLNQLITKKNNLPQFEPELNYFIFKQNLATPQPILALIIVASRLELKWRKSKLKRGYAVLLTIIIFLLVATSFIMLIIPAFISQFEELVKLVPQGIDELIIWLNYWILLIEERFSITLQESLPDFNEILAQLQPIFNELVNQSWQFFSNTLLVVLNSLLIFVLTLMILADPQSYRKGLIRFFPSFYRRRIDQILTNCEADLRGWLTGILLNMVVVTLFVFIGLIILKIPLALSQAMLAGLFTFIPNIGPGLSVIPPIAIALLESPWKSLAVLILYIVIQQLETNILTPLIIGKQLSLLPALTLLLQVFFATFFGILGLFLALPLTVIGQVFFQEMLIKDVLDQWYDKIE
jgi:predicted PurR-regulated permease PerM